MPNAYPGPAMLTSAPPTNIPVAPAALCEKANSAFVCCRCRGGVTSEISPTMVGLKNACARPWHANRASSSQSRALSVSNKRAAAPCETNRAMSAVSRTARRCRRSPTTPPRSVNARSGTRIAARANPTFAIEPVVWSTANANATFAKAFPNVEVVCPRKRWRTSRSASGARAERITKAWSYYGRLPSATPNCGNCV